MALVVLKIFKEKTFDMLVCFDLDGTLEDSRLDMVQAIQQLRLDLGLEQRTYECLVPWVSKGMPALYANAFDDVIDDSVLSTIPDLYAQSYARGIVQNTCLYDGVQTMLQSLDETVAMAVVTNKPEALARLLLKKLGVLHHFVTVIGGDTFDFAKPNPRMLQGALDRSGFSGAAQCIMVGDSAGDVKMAQAFGATSIWCQWGYHDLLSDVQPNIHVESPLEVVSVIESLSTVD